MITRCAYTALRKVASDPLNDTVESLVALTKSALKASKPAHVGPMPKILKKDNVYFMNNLLGPNGKKAGIIQFTNNLGNNDFYCLTERGEYVKYNTEDDTVY